jgi:hypothetical protein
VIKVFDLPDFTAARAGFADGSPDGRFRVELLTDLLLLAQMKWMAQLYARPARTH